MSEGKVMAALPQYQCHKKVWALKIAKIEPREDGAGAIITPEESGYVPFPVQYGYMVKHTPDVGGYFVVYRDGYQSYNPAKEFEDGYTLIQYNQELAYKVEPCFDNDASGEPKGCEHCGAGKLWDIIGPDGVALSSSYEDHETAVELAEMLTDAYYKGRDAHLGSILMIRCMKHREVPQLNTEEESGAECPICHIERTQDKSSIPLESFFDFLRPADEPVIEGMELAEVVYGAGQKEYIPLRTLPSNGPERRVLSRWSLRPDQREAVAKGGDIYLELLTFGQPLQPIRMAIGYKPLPEFVMRLMWPDDQPRNMQGTESDQKQ